MADKKLNIAVIGCSGMGKRHMEGVKATEGAYLYAICDTAPEQLESAKNEMGDVIAVSDYKELVNDPNLDAVVIVTPDQVHLEMTVAFLRAGKDVLCEKPMALTVEECDNAMNKIFKELSKINVNLRQ